MVLQNVMLYVMWNLFTVGSLQICNDSAISSLEGNFIGSYFKSFKAFIKPFEAPQIIVKIKI